jgi:hypothetical protein
MLPIWLALVVAVAIGVALWWVWRKGRPFAAGDVFVASRFSEGNYLFPTQVLVTPTTVVQFTPRWIGKQEETIHLAHVSSVKIDTGALFSNVLIETSGGSHPIRCSGHTTGDAARMKALIERYQNDHYLAGGRARHVAPKASPEER